MDGRGYRAWLQVGFDAWSLGAEASFVAGLRLARIATGGVPAAAETQRMVAEKIQAALELQADAALGRLGTTPLSASRSTLRHYRRKVGANRRRLER